MKYFILLMTLVLSSCSNNHQVNDGWVIYDLRPLQGGLLKGRVLLHQITAGAKVMFRMHLRI
jgi:hypothetical protein